MAQLKGEDQDAAWALGEAIYEATKDYYRPVLLGRTDRENVLRALWDQGWELKASE